MTTDNGYHTKATGLALTTADAHSTPQSLKLYGACFCPVVHRVWIQLELINSTTTTAASNDDDGDDGAQTGAGASGDKKKRQRVAYEYVEVDPYAKPAALLKLSPKGLVPAVEDDGWGCCESTVIMDYLEDLYPGTLLPTLKTSVGGSESGRGDGDGGDGKNAEVKEVARKRADQKRWAHYVNNNIVPGFYRLLQAQKEEDQVQHGQELLDHVVTLTKAMDETGPFFAGAKMGYVDAMVAPWVVRFEKVLKPYRGWSPERSGRWGRFVNAVMDNEAVKNTTSDDQLYLDSYKRYAENRPNTSQVANAINAGRSLP